MTPASGQKTTDQGQIMDDINRVYGNAALVSMFSMIFVLFGTVASVAVRGELKEWWRYEET
jgi:hypothetical protein